MGGAATSGLIYHPCPSRSFVIVKTRLFEIYAFDFFCATCILRPMSLPASPESPLMIGTTAVATRDDADALARSLVETRLAACVQIDGPVTSVYHWQGKLETTEEFRLTIKFPAANAAALETHLHARHPYDTPEWVAVRAEIVAEKYLSWARANSTFSPL